MPLISQSAQASAPAASTLHRPKGGVTWRPGAAEPIGGNGQSPADIGIQALSMEDLPAIAAVHRAAFPRAAVSRLGREVTQRYCDSLMSGPHEIVALGAFEKEWLVGYCFAGVWNSPETCFLRSNALFMAWHVLAHPWTLTDAFFRERIKYGLKLLWPTRKPRGFKKIEEPPPKTFTILYLAVEPGYQGRGIGRRLLDAAEEAARRKGFSQINLSLYLDNFKAITFYERNGWRRVRTDARWIGYMSKSLA